VDEVSARVDRLELPWSEFGTDPYGISKRHLTQAFSLLRPIYKHYFKVQTHGLEHIPKHGRAMLVGNHSGGVALDGAITAAACFYELEPPRLAQAMTDRFVNKSPFGSLWSNRLGHFTGLPEHAIRLLEEDRLLLVFPEGAKGTAKLFSERYDLVDFGTGFVRLAMKAKAPIVPFAFLGGGEAIPTVHNSKRLGALFGAPYVPITPYLLTLPLPVQLDLYVSEPMWFEGSGNEDDKVVQDCVDQVKARIAGLLDAGYKKRRGIQ
jgi:1-acyl-sn-glycerol-3-phosphate acyltransferase